jgi:hypothetical protein
VTEIKADYLMRDQAEGDPIPMCEEPEEEVVAVSPSLAHAVEQAEAAFAQTTTYKSYAEVLDTLHEILEDGAELETRMAVLKVREGRLKNTIQAEAAADPTLKNDAQRNAKIAELSEASTELQEIRSQMAECQVEIRDNDIDREEFRLVLGLLKMQLQFIVGMTPGILMRTVSVTSN